MAYNRRRSSANSQKSPVSIASFVTGGVSIMCLCVLLLCFTYLVRKEAETNMVVLGVLFVNLIVSVTSLAFSLNELKKQGFDFVTRIICFVVSLLPVIAYVVLYFFGFTS